MMNKYLAVDYRISSKSEISLLKMGYKLIKIHQSNSLEYPVGAHPDMFMTKIDEYLFVSGTVHNLFTNFGSKIIICNREVSEDHCLRYPYDIEFNCVQVGNKLICNKKYTNRTVVEYAEKNDITVIDTKQGYAKCSTCVVGDNAVITEDDSIAENAAEYGIDVLKISKGSVGLDGYNYGFIGGASGLIENKLLAFNGNLHSHPDFDKIFKFCFDRGVGIVSLSDDELYDIGSIIRIV